MRRMRRQSVEDDIVLKTVFQEFQRFMSAKAVVDETGRSVHTQVRHVDKEFLQVTGAAMSLYCDASASSPYPGSN